MTDIVEWLRDSSNEYGMARCQEAADEIERLIDVADSLRDEIDRVRAHYRTENTRLRNALDEFIDHFGPLEDNPLLNDEARRCFALARIALDGDEHD